MTKEKAMYQAWLIIESLPREEKLLIPQEVIEKIEDTMEYDESITIDKNIPWEKQKFDDKVWKILKDVITKIEKTGYNINAKKENRGTKDSTISAYLKSVKESNQNYNDKIENVRLKELLKKFQNESNKISQAKNLLFDYNEALKQKNKEIENLKRNNKDLYDCIQKLPSIIRKIFIKDLDIKLLKD